MSDFILFMHDDAAASDELWPVYLQKLSASGIFRGGSSIGAGASFRKSGPAGEVARHIVGFIRIEAASLDEAREALSGNPVYESGGTVEIRELPQNE